MNKTRVLSAVIGSLLFLAGMAVGQINANRHPNLAAALADCQQARQKVTAAQRANEWDMDGHAAKAKDFLEQSIAQLKQSAAAANRNKK